MVTDDDTYDDEDDLPDDPPKKPNWRRKLEQDAAAGREAQEKAAKLERELAFAKAGIDPADPKMSYFVKGYDGEMTADAVKKAATEAGFIGQAAAPPAEPTAAEVAALDRVSQASAGAGTAQAADPVKGLYDADREGGREAVLAQLVKDGLVNVE